MFESKLKDLSKDKGRVKLTLKGGTEIRGDVHAVDNGMATLKTGVSHAQSTILVAVSEVAALEI